MNTIRTLLILLAAAILTAACIDSHPKTPTLNTTDPNITAEEFVYGGHQWIAFFYQFDTRKLFDVKHDPNCPCQGAPAGGKEDREDTPAFQVIPAYQPYNTSKQ